MTELDLKYQDLKRKYEELQEENKRIRFSNLLLEKELEAVKCALIRAKDKQIESIGQVDLSDLRVPMISVHVNTSEYPRKVVARIFDANKPTNAVMIKNTLGEIQRDIQENTTMVFVSRSAEDVESLVGVWL